MTRSTHRALALVLGVSMAAAVGAAEPPKEANGKDLVFDRAKGNCLACHDLPGVPGVEMPGNVGPALTGVAARYTRETLRARIWDAAQANPRTAMPPFGRNKILTEPEIDKVTDFILSL